MCIRDRPCFAKMEVKRKDAEERLFKTSSCANTNRFFGHGGLTWHTAKNTATTLSRPPTSSDSVFILDARLARKSATRSNTKKASGRLRKRSAPGWNR